MRWGWRNPRRRAEGSRAAASPADARVRRAPANLPLDGEKGPWSLEVQDRAGEDASEVVTPALSKRILQALADALPEDGPNNLMSRIELRRGWGDAINIDIYPGTDPQAATGRRQIEQGLRASVDRALGPQRHSLQVHWGAALLH